jgi:hypothetical protein
MVEAIVGSGGRRGDAFFGDFGDGGCGVMSVSR